VRRRLLLTTMEKQIRTTSSNHRRSIADRFLRNLLRG